MLNHTHLKAELSVLGNLKLILCFLQKLFLLLKQLLQSLLSFGELVDVLTSIILRLHETIPLSLKEGGGEEGRRGGGEGGREVGREGGRWGGREGDKDFNCCEVLARIVRVELEAMNP